MGTDATAGDEFQGTLFYNFYKGEKISDILGMVQVDAMTIGNHEFDDGPELLAGFLHSLPFPVVCANIDSTVSELMSAIVPYHIFEERQLAVIGMITPTTSSISSSGPNVTFSEPVDIIQPVIDEIRSQGIKRIIALTHIGYMEDLDLVRHTSGLSMIVGGHSHTLLGRQPNAVGPYPTWVRDVDGRKVPVITDYRWGEYLGNIRVQFADDGSVLYTKRQPLHLDASTEKDPALDRKIKSWRKPFDKFAQQVIGRATAAYDESSCQFEECEIGNLVADAMLRSRRQNGGRVNGALMNAGGIRASINKGNVTRGEILTALPFGSAITDLTFTGSELWRVIEGIVSWRNVLTGHAVTSFLQVAGIKVVYDPAREPGQRLQALYVLDADNDDIMNPVEANTTYTITTLDFMARGGDYWWGERTDFIGKETRSRQEANVHAVLNQVDEVVMQYIETEHTVTPYTDGRIAYADSSTGLFARIAYLILEPIAGLLPPLLSFWS